MSSPQMIPNPSDSNARHEALLDISDIVCTHRDPEGLMHHLAARLRKVVDFDYVALFLHDPETEMMRFHILEVLIPGPIPESPRGMRVKDAPGGWAFENQQYLIFDP